MFLDVAMPEVDGFDVARHLAEPRPLIIFQTAYAQFAVKAFEHEALDYVVKPVTRERLAQALERAQRRLASSGAARRLAAPTPGRISVPRSATRRRGPSGYSCATARAIGSCPSRRSSGSRADERLVYAVAGQTRHGTDYTLQELEARFGGAFVRGESFRAGEHSPRHRHHGQWRRLGDADALVREPSFMSAGAALPRYAPLSSADRRSPRFLTVQRAAAAAAAAGVMSSARGGAHASRTDGSGRQSSWSMGALQAWDSGTLQGARTDSGDRRARDRHPGRRRW